MKFGRPERLPTPVTVVKFTCTKVLSELTVCFRWYEISKIRTIKKYSIFK